MGREKEVGTAREKFKEPTLTEVAATMESALKAFMRMKVEALKMAVAELTAG